MANELRTRDGLPFNFVDGLRIKGVDVTNWDKVFIDQGASYVGFTPVGNLAASNVQAAIAELESEKQSKTEPITTAINLRPGANQGIVWDNDAFGGTQDTASITLETAAGEATKMRFKMTNDSDDNFEFTAKTADGLTAFNNAMTLNGNVLLNAANYVDYAAPMISDYTALRAYTGSASQVRITTNGLAGFFYYDAADTTSADNGGTIIVASNGKRWKRLFDGAVNVKWFGVLGNGADDGPGVQKAVDYLKGIGGGSLVFEPNKVYYWGTVKIFAGLRIDLNGSVIKMLSNQVDFARLFTMAATGYYYNGTSSSQPLVIENGILDVSRADQGTYTGYEKEHHAAICLASDAVSQGKVLVHIRNLIIKESCGDGINLTYGVKGVIENCHFSNHFRGGIVASGGGHDIVIKDCTSGGDVHDKALDFEPVPSLGGPYRLTIENFKVGGKVDIGAGNCPGSRIVVNNLTMSAPAFTLFGSEGTKFIFNDCRFVTTDNSNVSVIRQWRDATFNRCTIVAEKTVSGAEPVYGLFAWHDDIAGQVLRLNKCKFEVGATIVPTDTTYGIYQNAMSIATRCSIILDDCEFVGYDYAIWVRGSILDARNCKADSDFFYVRGTVGTYENIITVQGRLSIPSGKVPFRQDGSTAQATIKFFEHEVDAGDGAAGSGENTLLFSGWTNITKIGTRKLIVTNTPAGGGLLGDCAKLSSPVFGAASEWTSVTNHNTSATWKMTQQCGVKKDATLNRPTPTAADAGLRYLDTTLDPDGKPIWWTGSTWVDATGTVV